MSHCFNKHGEHNVVIRVVEVKSKKKKLKKKTLHFIQLIINLSTILKPDVHNK